VAGGVAAVAVSGTGDPAGAVGVEVTVEAATAAPEAIVVGDTLGANVG
jgi:hypothetical protein